MNYRVYVYKTTRMATLEVEGKSKGEALSAALKAAVSGKAEFGWTDCPFLAVATPAGKPPWEKGVLYSAAGIVAMEKVR